MKFLKEWLACSFCLRILFLVFHMKPKNDNSVFKETCFGNRQGIHPPGHTSLTTRFMNPFIRNFEMVFVCLFFVFIFYFFYLIHCCAPEMAYQISLYSNIIRLILLTTIPISFLFILADIRPPDRFSSIAMTKSIHPSVQEKQNNPVLRIAMFQRIEQQCIYTLIDVVCEL